MSGSTPVSAMIFFGGREADAVNVGQADFNALVARKVDTNKTCHRLYLLFLPSPDAAYGAGSRR